MSDDGRSRFVAEEDQFTIKPKTQKDNEGDKKKPKAQKTKPDDESNKGVTNE